MTTIANSRYGDIWTKTGLDQARDMEDLDRAVDVLLQEYESGSPVSPNSSVKDLADLLGVKGVNLCRVCGFRPRPDVAAVRVLLIRASGGRCLEEAERVKRRENTRTFVQALRVCGALQFEVLGRSETSDALMQAGHVSSPLASIFAQAVQALAGLDASRYCQRLRGLSLACLGSDKI